MTSTDSQECNSPGVLDNSSPYLQTGIKERLPLQTYMPGKSSVIIKGVTIHCDTS